MDNCEFIQERENQIDPRLGVMTGWETIVFQVEDEPPDD